MGQKLDTMGQKQSKDELLYQAAIAGNVDGIKALCREGAGLEWIDRDGKTPLIVACMNPELLDVAKTLIELGANVNAYRPGRNAGTPLHHAAKRGLEQTVKLLLSHGANILLRNDDCHTPLEVARIKGCTNVVRAIENHICCFSGWLREFHGPGFLGGFAPQLLSRKIWVVIIPCGSGNPMRPPRYELAIYSTLQVIPSPTVLNSQTSSTANAHLTAAESAEVSNNQSSGAGVHGNGWENSANAESYNGWGPPVGQEHSELSNTGWKHGPTGKDYNGWGVPDSRSTGKQSHHVQTLGDHSGWMDAPTKNENGWAVPDSRPTGNQSYHVVSLLDPPPHVQTSGFNASISSSPSAPPIPEDVLVEEPSQYASTDLNAADLPVSATIDYGASKTNDAKKGDCSSSCIICWEAPVEGACIPCGHMAGCMSCLNEIKAKNGICPVCRGEIDQVIRLYTV